MQPSMRFGVSVFLVFAFLAFVFGVFPGGWVEEEVDTEATLLTSTYAAVAVVLTVAVTLTSFRRGEAWAWWSLWVWPLFFVVHGAAFFPVDFVFAALGVGALLLTRPGGAPGPEGRDARPDVAEQTR